MLFALVFGLTALSGCALADPGGSPMTRSGGIAPVIEDAPSDSHIQTADRSAVSRTLCRSAEAMGKCAERCAGGSREVAGPLISECDDGGVCCTTDFFTAEELEAAETDGEDPEMDDYDPGHHEHSSFLIGPPPPVSPIDLADLFKQYAPASGGPCWGSRVPHDCGEAFFRGQSRGHKMCVYEGRNKARITTDMFCQYKRWMEAAKRETGQPFILTSSVGGFRTMAHQTRLRVQNCGADMKPPCHPQTGRPGWSRHQNGIAFDIAVAAYPKLFRWLRENATKYGFVRTVSSENWHWEFRPGDACDKYVKYPCSSPAFIPIACDGADEPSSETAGLVCREKSHCHAGHIPNKCSGATFCCNPVPCTDGSGRNCVLESEAEFGVDKGLCPGSLYCPKPPRKCDGDPTRICRARSACALYGSDAGLCGDSGLNCCITTPPRCSRDSSRACSASSHKNCRLFGNDAGQCPGSSTCCRATAKCNGQYSEFNCVDPAAPVPAGFRHQGGHCPGASICLVSANATPEREVPENPQDPGDAGSAENTSGLTPCRHDQSRFCRAPNHRLCQLFENESGFCPGRGASALTCCNTSAKCSRQWSSYSCVDPQDPIPAGMRHQSGFCPGASVCLIPA